MPLFLVLRVSFELSEMSAVSGEELYLVWLDSEKLGALPDSKLEVRPMQEYFEGR
jgi:hypothetical protein